VHAKRSDLSIDARFNHAPAGIALIGVTAGDFGHCVSEPQIAERCAGSPAEE
jgi:hypothetical protein